MRSGMTKFAAMTFAVAAMAAVAAFAASAWEGVWEVKDTAGHEFKITLTPDGKAKSSLHEEMVGTWKEEGGAAVIKWQTGWVTKISKAGDKFKKTGYRPGTPLDGPPSNSSEAEKEK